MGSVSSKLTDLGRAAAARRNPFPNTSAYSGGSAGNGGGSPPAFSNGGVSLDFTRSNGDHLTTAVGSSTFDFNIGNTFTLMAWVNTDAAGPGTVRHIFGLGDPSAGDQHHINLTHRAGTADDYGISITDTDGVVTEKVYTFGSVTNLAWTQLVVTWNGTDLLVYQDGSAETPVQAIDEAVTLINVPRRANIGSSGEDGGEGGGGYYDGRIHQIALWTSVLTPAEISSIYNSGNGDGVNLKSATGSYNSQADLEHWYVLGASVDPNLGEDTGNGTAVDISVPIGITDLDITASAPT